MSVLEPLAEEGLASATARCVTFFLVVFMVAAFFLLDLEMTSESLPDFLFSGRMIGVFVIWNMSFTGNTCIELSMTL
jgi:hypothetical protein